MTTCSQRWSWALGLLSSLCVNLLATTAPLAAQVTSDGTLGTKVNGSILPCLGGTCTITGGTTDATGRNLFHSFKNFSVPTSGEARFENLPNIQNIFSRVTGGTGSYIDGTISANSSANVFILNPHSIIFGPNAQLNIGGSFVATTANAIQFGSKGSFGPTTLNDVELLTVDPSAFLFNQIAPGPTNSIENRGNLQVNNGRSLLLVGGNASPNSTTKGSILIDGTFWGDASPAVPQLSAPGGRVEIGGLAAPGAVGLNIDKSNPGLMSLSYPLGVERVDVSLAKDAFVDVRAGNGGSIAISARNLNMSAGSNGGSVLLAGIRQGMGFNGAQAGDITLEATGALTLDGSAALNLVGTKATGNAGKININAGSLTLEHNAVVSSSIDTQGTGNAGDINIDVRDALNVAGTGQLPPTAAIINFVAQGGTGNAGNININAFSLSLNNYSAIEASTFGTGNAGNISIQTRGSTSIINNSTINSYVYLGAVGKGGNIDIKANSFVTKDGSHVDSRTFGRGDGGSISIKANSFALTDGSVLETSTADLPTGSQNPHNLPSGAVGNAGNVNLDVKDTLTIARGSAVLSYVDRQSVGNGGHINFSAGEISLDGAGVCSCIFGKGNAGRISVQAFGGDVLLANSDINNTVTSGIGNDITIQTASLTLRDGTRLKASTFGTGNAGNIAIDAANSFSLKGSNSSRLTSGIFTETSGTGNAGSLTIATRHLTIQDGATASASTSGKGHGGSVAVNASDSVELSNGGSLSVSSVGSGNAGEMEVQARSIFLDNQGKLIAQTASGEGGNIKLAATESLIMRHNSSISAKAEATGNGGNIYINAPFIIAVPNENSDIVANAFQGRGGRIEVTTQGIYGLKYRPQITDKSDINASSEYGVNGTVQINTPGIDPSKALINLPTEVVNVEGLVKDSCPALARSNQSQFVVTGRGGLPPNPQETLSTDALAVNWVTLPTEVRIRESAIRVKNHGDSIQNLTPPAKIPHPLVEAQGWVVNDRGQVVLTAVAPNGTPQSTRLTSASCRTAPIH